MIYKGLIFVRCQSRLNYNQFHYLIKITAPKDGSVFSSAVINFIIKSSVILTLRQVVTAIRRKMSKLPSLR